MGTFFQKTTALALIFVMVAASLFTTSCATSGYKNVDPSSRLSKIRIGMGDRQVGDILGPPTDLNYRIRGGMILLDVALTMIIIGVFIEPPYSEKICYYKDAGRVYFSPGWSMISPNVAKRVSAVIGDPNEDGYK